jgi:hypothetical protein
MTFFQAWFIAIFQGVTELFPVSSLGHAVILPTLLGWNFDQQSSRFLPFLVVLHVGTAAALLVYFWREWLRLFMAVLGRGKSAGEVSRERNLIVDSRAGCWSNGLCQHRLSDEVLPLARGERRARPLRLLLLVGRRERARDLALDERVIWGTHR